MTDVLDKNLPGALGDKCWWDEEGEALVTREADSDGDYGVCSDDMVSYRYHRADNPSVQRMLAATMPLVVAMTTTDEVHMNETDEQWEAIRAAADRAREAFLNMAAALALLTRQIDTLGEVLNDERQYQHDH